MFCVRVRTFLYCILISLVFPLPFFLTQEWCPFTTTSASQSCCLLYGIPPFSWSHPSGWVTLWAWWARLHHETSLLCNSALEPLFPAPCAVQVLVFSLVTVSGSVWEITLLSFVWKNNNSSMIFCCLFPLSLADSRIFLFMLLGFLICLMVLGCLFIFKTEGLDCDYFR